MKGIIFTEEGIKCIFEEADELENIQSGESVAAIFGKIQKWFPHFSEFSSILDGDGNLVLPANIKLNNKELISPGTGEYSLIIGDTNNTASGTYSATIGKGNTASEAGAFAVGHSNTASSPDAIAIGYRNNASQTYSVAIGGNNTATAPGAVAIGSGNNATDLGAVAMGKGCLANSKVRTALGRYNRIDSTDYSFVVGNGVSTEARSNALTLDFDGNLRTAGDVTATDPSGKSISLCELQKSLGMTKGKNLLKNTVGTITQKGITFTYNSDGSVTCNGTATADTNYRFVITLPQNTSFILSGCPAGGSISTYQLFAMDTDTWSNIYRDIGNGKTFNTESHTEWTFTIRISNGQTVNNLTFYPMLRDASITDSSYEPYVDDLQTQINELKAKIAALTSSATMADMQGVDTE